MNLEQIQLESKGYFEITFNPILTLNWGSVRITKHTTLQEVAHKHRMILKPVKRGLYCYISAEGDIIDIDSLSHPQRRIFLFLPPIIVRELSITCWVRFCDSVIHNFDVRVQSISKQYDLCPIFENGDFTFVDEQRNPPQQTVINSTRVKFGCDTRDERNCWVIYYFK